MTLPPCIPWLRTRHTMFNHALKPLGGTHPKTFGSYHETNGRDAKDCSCLWSWPHRAQSLLSNSKKSNFNVLAESLIEQHLLGTDSSGAINDLSRSVLFGFAILEQLIGRGTPQLCWPATTVIYLKYLKY